MSETTPTMAEALASLQAFVKVLAKRSDVEVIAKQLGKPAPARLIAHHRQHPELLPAHVVAFYELMNGANVAWRFRDGGGGGALHIPALDFWPRFATDDENANDFGAGKVSAFFEANVGESGTWLVADADAPTATAELRYAEQGDGDPGFVVAATVAEYLRNAVAAGLAERWQEGADTPRVQERVARILAPPVTPAKIRAGVRVEAQCQYCHHYRGQVLETYTLPADTELKHHAARQHRNFALVRFDLGPTLWTGIERNLKVLPKTPDLYEQLRTDPWELVRIGEAGNWEKSLRYLALAWTVSAVGNDCWWVAASLRALPPAEALALAQQLVAGIVSLALPLRQWQTIPEDEWPLATNPRSWKASNNKASWWQYDWKRAVDKLLDGLQAHLRLTAAQAGHANPSADAVAAIAALRPEGPQVYTDVWGELPFHHARRVAGLPGDYFYIS